MRAGDTFFPIARERLPHLWLVITSPGADRQLAIVNVTTKRLGSDETCVLQIGDHPFIRHDSVVLYEKAQTADADDLEGAMVELHLEARTPLPPAVLARVQSGALSSVFTPRGVKAMVRRELGMAD